MALRVALGQFNACVGDIAGNAAKIGEFIRQAEKLGANLLVFPEMCICGYPPEDLLHKRHFLIDNRRAVEQLAKDHPQETIVVGFAEIDGDRDTIRYNSLAVLQDGAVKHIYRKGLLPNYGVFDEQRYFHSGNEPLIMDIKGVRVAFTICEDIWDLDWLGEFFADTGQKDLIVNISASPFYVDKLRQRRQIFTECASHFGCAMAYCNLVGGQDELVFDGRSMFVGATGKVVSEARAFAEDLLVADISVEKQPASISPVAIEGSGDLQPPADMDVIEEVYRALILGTRDYLQKNGFKRVLIGLSGGIDSSLVAAIAVSALGAENVVGITMPSRFNSPETIGDAERLAQNLDLEFYTVPISAILSQFNTTLDTVPGWDDATVAFENLQARIRGSILMSLSNQFGLLVLTTGNKSETAVGYSTLYGDTAGGFAVIKDVPKTMVYKLSEYVNKVSGKKIIPVSVIKRPPSAELREDQKDSDSLPDYDILDAILEGYIVEDKSVKELIDTGLEEDVVRRVITLVDRNEYKRRQSPPGVKITPKAFGKDRRMPITNRYRSQ